MTNEEILNYQFDDPDLDNWNLPMFDFALRHAFIKREITKDDYLAIEEAWQSILEVRHDVSERAFEELKEVLNNL